MIQSFDLVIIGAGMVGLALARGLRESELRIAVIDAHQSAPLAAGSQPQLRVSALSPENQAWLEKLGAWPAIQASGRLGVYTRMAVWERDSFGRVEFSADEVGGDRLGTIVENRNIREALWQQVAAQGNVKLIAPARCQQLAFGEQEAWITLDNGQSVTARLVVGADGANSWVREQADVPLTFWDYDHHALVATVRCQQPHRQTARQIFQPDGPLAFLPLWEPDLCSIVWSVPPEKARQLQAMDDEAFGKVLTVAFDHCLGLVTVEGPRQAIPLRMRYARRFIGHRLALIGDAAHTIHPLAGQGVNLGFRDARALAESLHTLAEREQDIGSERLLRGYERERKSDAGEMIAAMEFFKRLYGNDDPGLRLARNVGMSLFGRVTPIKRAMVQKAMGLSDRQVLAGLLPISL